MNLLSNIELNEIENAVESLSAAREFLNSPNHTVFEMGCYQQRPRLRHKMKWAMIALHCSLYGFAICALHQGNDENVLWWNRKKMSSRKILFMQVSHFVRSKLDAMVRKSFQGNRWRPLPRFMRSYAYHVFRWHNEYELKRERIEVKQLISFPEAIKRCKKQRLLTLPKSDINAIKSLNANVRNAFMHFTPGKKLWQFFESDPEIHATIDAIYLLALQTGNIKLTDEQKATVWDYLNEVSELCSYSWYFHFPHQKVIHYISKIHNSTTQAVNRIVPLRNSNPQIM